MSTATWPLQEAKAHFSELIRVCTNEGPQFVSVRGEEKAVVISKQDYEKLIGSKISFVEFMNKSPLKGLKLDLTRDMSSDRDINL